MNGSFLELHYQSGDGRNASPKGQRWDGGFFLIWKDGIGSTNVKDNLGHDITANGGPMNIYIVKDTIN